MALREYKLLFFDWELCGSQRGSLCKMWATCVLVGGFVVFIGLWCWCRFSTLHLWYDFLGSLTLGGINQNDKDGVVCFHYGDLHFGGLSACMNEFLTLLALPLGFFQICLFRHAVSTLILCLLTT